CHYLLRVRASFPTRRSSDLDKCYGISVCFGCICRASECEFAPYMWNNCSTFYNYFFITYKWMELKIFCCYHYYAFRYIFSVIDYICCHVDYKRKWASLRSDGFFNETLSINIYGWANCRISWCGNGCSYY